MKNFTFIAFLGLFAFVCLTLGTNRAEAYGWGRVYEGYDYVQPYSNPYYSYNNYNNYNSYGNYNNYNSYNDYGAYYNGYNTSYRNYDNYYNGSNNFSYVRPYSNPSMGSGGHYRPYNSNW